METRRDRPCRREGVGHGPASSNYSLIAIALAVCLSAPGVVEAMEEAGPRPPRLTDVLPRSTLVVGGDFGFLRDTTGLSLPVSARVQISPELALDFDLPFGYVNERGDVVEPMFGNLGVGLVGSSAERLAQGWRVRWALEISGRVPTGADLEDPQRAERFARLRSVTPFRRERWSPDTAALRVDAAASLGTDDMGGQIQAGVLGALPLGDGPATAHPHYGVMAGYRVHRSLWAQVEVLGGSMSHGAAGRTTGQYVTVAGALRLEMVRVSPVLYVSVPAWGDVEEDRPVVIGIEIASW